MLPKLTLNSEDDRKLLILLRTRIVVTRHTYGFMCSGAQTQGCLLGK